MQWTETTPEPLEEASCERLFEITRGRMEPLLVARLLDGPRAGRLSVMRAVPPEVLEAVADAIGRATSIAHPRLSKFLGVVRAEGRAYIASEYIDGVTFGEFRSALLEANEAIDPSIVARIVRDVLEGAAACAALLAQQGAEPGARLLFEDAVWIATYGETLLADGGVLHAIDRVSRGGRLLDESGSRFTLQGDMVDSSAEASDVLVAGSWLYELMMGPAAVSANMSDPRECARALSQTLVARKVRGGHALVSIVARALETRAALRFDGPAAMAAALSRLPDNLLASEQRVTEELTRLLGPKLEQRRALITSSENDANPFDFSGGETQCFRVGTLEPVVPGTTARPARAVSRPPPKPVRSARPHPPVRSSEPTPDWADAVPLAVGADGHDGQDATRLYRRSEFPLLSDMSDAEASPARPAQGEVGEAEASESVGAEPQVPVQAEGPSIEVESRMSVEADFPAAPRAPFPVKSLALAFVIVFCAGAAVGSAVTRWLWLAPGTHPGRVLHGSGPAR